MPKIDTRCTALFLVDEQKNQAKSGTGKFGASML
jgi:hypothetical protein